MSHAYAGFEPHPDPDGVLDPLVRRYGFAPEVFDDHRLWHRPGAPAIWLTRRECEPPEAESVEAFGLLALRQPPPRGFPTTGFLRRFGHEATRWVRELDWTRGVRLLCGDSVDLGETSAPKGPWIVRVPDAVIGRGWIRTGELRLDVPKARRIQLRATDPEEASAAFDGSETSASHDERERER